MITGIRSCDKNPYGLFHAVYESWKDEEALVSFTATHEERTKMIVNGLISYLKYEYGKDTLFFLQLTLSWRRVVERGIMRPYLFTILSVMI